MRIHRAISRRRFLAGSSAAAAFTIIPRHVLGAAAEPSANQKLNIAAVGVGGMGGHDIQRVSSEHVAAICDVDARFSARAAQAFPEAKVYSDFREMLEVHPDLDAVMVATPDHNHAVVAVTAMKMGKHVFCQKPLTHSVHEALTMAKVAKREPGGDPDGQPGPGERRGPADLRVHPGRCDRQRSARSIPGRTVARHLPARHSPTHRDAARAGGARLGPLARPGAPAAVSPCLPSLSPGAAGGISAPACWATSAATTCRPPSRP